MGATTTTLSNLIRPNVAAGPSKSLVFQETDLVNWLRSLGRFTAQVGGSPFKWNIASAENSSAEVYVENQALPSAGQRSYAQASVSAFYARTVASVTGHVRDQQRTGAFYEDAEQAELASATRALMKQVEDSLLGTTYGLPVAVDSTTTYAGIAVGTVAAWASYELAVGGALSLAALDLMYRTLIGRGGTPSHILTVPAQITAYTGLANVGHATATPVFLGQLPGQGGVFDMGLIRTMPTWNGIPFVQQRNMTSGELYMLDVNTARFEVAVHRDLTVEPLAKVNDNQQWQLSMAQGLIVERRDIQGKLTGLT